MSTNSIQVATSHVRGLTPLGKISLTASPKKSPIRTPDIVQCQNIFDLLNDDNLPSDSDTDSVPPTERKAIQEARKNSTVSQPETLILSPSTSSENFAVYSPLPVSSKNPYNIKARYLVHSPSTQPVVQPSPMHVYSFPRATQDFQKKSDPRRMNSEYSNGEYSKRDPEKLAFTKACYYVEKDGTPGEYGVCNKKGCTFAHTLQELRVPKCRYSDTCKHGKNCYYIHTNETIQQYYKRIGKSVPNLPNKTSLLQGTIPAKTDPSLSAQSPIPSLQFSSPSKELVIMPSLKEEPETSFHDSRESSTPQEKVHEEVDTAAQSCTESHTSCAEQEGPPSTIHVPLQYLDKVLDIIKNKKYTGVDIRIS